MNAVNHACCSASPCNATHVPSTCSADCAIAFQPFYSSCKRTVDALYDTRGSDKLHDGKSPAFAELKTKCVSLDPGLFIPRVDALLAKKCKVNLTAIVAKGSALVSSKCVDRNEDLRKLLGVLIIMNRGPPSQTRIFSQQPTIRVI